MSEPTCPRERARWLRERAVTRGVSVEEQATYTAKLRGEYRRIGGGPTMAARVVTALGFGSVSVQPGTYTPAPAEA